MSTIQIVLLIGIGTPIVGSILLLGAVMAGRAAMRDAIESGRVHPQCPHPTCPYRQLGAVPQPSARHRQAPERREG